MAEIAHKAIKGTEERRQRDRLMRVMRAASVFAEERYSTRGIHLGMVSDFLIDKTDVGEFIKELNSRDAGSRKREILEMRLGDPTAKEYEDIGPYPGYDRHSRRFKNFNSSESYAGYLIQGDEQLKARVRLGRTKTPGYIHPPAHMEVYITGGVAGGLRLSSTALLLPPTEHKPDLAKLEDLERRLKGGESTEGLREDLLGLVQALKTESAPDEVIIPKYTYVSHMAEIALAHADFIMCDITKEGQVDLDDLSRVINRNTRAVLFATVGNPLTTAMKPELFDRILELVAQKSEEYGAPIVVIADTIYEQFRRDRSSRIDAIQRALKAGSKVPMIELSSFSKMLSIPGERAGFARVLWEPSLYPDRRASFLKAMNNVYGPGLGQVSVSVQRALGSMYSGISAKLPVEEELAPIAAVMAALAELSGSKEPQISHGDTDLFFRDKAARESGWDNRKEKEALQRAGVGEGYFSVKKLANRARKIAGEELKLYGVDLKPSLVFDIGRRLEEAGYVTSEHADEVTFFKLVGKVPRLERHEHGGLRLYRISERSDWQEVARQCKVVTEDVLYQEHKKQMRDNVHQRVFYFAQGLDQMRREGLGVYLHPAYYNESGELDPARFNAFYVLWGFERLKKYQSGAPSQARLLAEKCEALGKPIIACVPGESFLPSELKEEETSYIRSVALLPVERMDAVLEIIRLAARELDCGM